jgi:hypothetical protein
LLSNNKIIGWKKKKKRWAIQREFEHVGSPLFKNPLDARWGLLPTLWWVGVVWGFGNISTFFIQHVSI